MSPRAASFRPRGAVRALLGLCSVALLSAPACSKPARAPAAPVAPPAREAPTAAPATPAQPAAAAAPAEAAIQEQLTALFRRGGCSRLMGCPPADALVQLGRPALAAILTAWQTHQDGSYATERLIDIVADIGGPEAEAFLQERLADNRPTLATRAALGLGALRATAAAAPLRQKLAALAGGPDVGQRAAIGYALAQLGDRTELRCVAEALGASQAGFVLVGLEIAARLGEPAWLDPVLAAAARDNLLVRRQAMQALGRYRDRRAVAALMRHLDDASSGVRRLAAKALAGLLGGPADPRPEAWQQRCAQSAWCGSR